MLSREGTEQQQRFIEALDPSSVKLNDFELRDWLLFAYEFASHVNFFDVSNEQLAAGTWQSFFKSEAELEDFLQEVSSGAEITPHLALFVVFVKLIEISKQRFNKLTQRHLDFYFGEVLKISKQAATPDKVHVLFELAKNAVSEKIAEETELDGGKDTDGKKRIYKTTEEMVANQAKVSLLKNVCNDHDKEIIKGASVANSYDGNGEDFPDDEISWWPFGNPELKDAKIGFALAGEILELGEGERNVRISVIFKDQLSSSITADDLIENLKIYCTGEKEWTESLDIKEQVLDEDGEEVYSSGLANDKKTLNIVFQIPREKEAVVNYDPEIHGQAFSTDNPVCRVIIDTSDSGGHRLYRKLIQQPIAKINIDVDVRGVKGLSLSNDIGKLKADKPFYPFGTQPVKKSKFYVDYEELYKKKWTNLNLRILWKNTPDDFKTWYYAYRGEFKNTVSKYQFLDGIYDKISVEDLTSVTEAVETLNDQVNVTKDVADLASDLQENIAQVAAAEKWQIVSDPTNLIVTGDDYFTAKVEYKDKEEWKNVSGLKSVQLFKESTDDSTEFELNLLVSNPKSEEQNVGPIRLSLNQTFLHEMFARLYALAMSSDEEDTLIPNEPYTPFVEEIDIDYQASASVVPKVYNKNEADFVLFHEHPYGQSKESVNLKKESGLYSAEEAGVLNVVPTYCKGGELYIGLENAEVQETVSLLIQVLEGSEDPEVDTFVGKQKVEWAVLCNNFWKNLSSNEIIKDNTVNFLQSGMFKFVIPRDATDTNTLLPAGYIWLRARIHKKYNAVSKVLGIHAQVVTAEFENNDNNLEHLEKGLPEKTISKMVKRIPKVKGLTQPYNSFDGLPEESDVAYYRRISERLRHKNRAITSWDYEHLVLQNFPEIYKVKCLNHTCLKVVENVTKTNYLVPGRVVLVVIPDIVNKNVFDIYQPRVSQATLNNIQDYLNRLNSPLTGVKVINPGYEEVRVDLQVQFHKDYDEVYYKTVLNEDITRLLSPWAFDNTAAIQFGLSLHKSVIINYIEELEYVDFVSYVKLFQRTESTQPENLVNVAVPSRPESILVSAKEHGIHDIINYCSNSTAEPPETCQA